ncbi:MAG TPA: hypothetical protein VHO48_14285, partial [Anaerolineaceae bacterium]|nr:hypothetical protein [Anaerolineaceae bacterium]
SSAFLLGFLRRDFAATGLFAMQQQGLLNGVQVVVSIVTITLFIPCIASLFMIIKERGNKTALAMAAGAGFIHHVQRQHQGNAHLAELDGQQQRATQVLGIANLQNGLHRLVE